MSARGPVGLLERRLRALGAWLWRHSAWWRRIPSEFRAGIILVVVFAGGFIGIVGPLLTGGGGTPTAEVNGRMPDQVGAGQIVTVPLAVDNTGDSVIGPLCLKATVDPPTVLAAVDVSFQGLETVPVAGGQACGGTLSGGEVISVTLRLRGSATGSARVTVVATLHGRELGPQLHAIVAVVPAGG